MPPDFYGIEYEINPWMSRDRQSDRSAAQAQWAALEQYSSTQAQIELLPPQSGLPDMVFTANAALIYRKLAVMARFKHSERQGEVPFRRSLAARQHLEIRHVPETLHFEGAGGRPLLRRNALCRLSHSQRRTRAPANWRNARLPCDSPSNLSIPITTISTRASVRWLPESQFIFHLRSTAPAAPPYKPTCPN